jgi:hypothetical protein
MSWRNFKKVRSAGGKGERMMDCIRIRTSSLVPSALLITDYGLRIIGGKGDCMRIRTSSLVPSTFPKHESS